MADRRDDLEGLEAELTYVQDNWTDELSTEEQACITELLALLAERFMKEDE